MEQKDPPPDWVRQLGLLSVVVVDLLIYTGSGFAFGYFLWLKAGFPQASEVITTLAGLSLSMYRIYQRFV